MTLLFFGTLRSERSVQRIEICPAVFRKSEWLFCRQSFIIIYINAEKGKRFL